MKDKIKRYVRLLWKYKYLILWAVLVIMFWGRWGGKAYPLVERVIYAVILSSVLVGFLAVTVWFVKGYVGFLIWQSDYMKELNEQTLEIEFQRKMRKKRARELKRSQTIKKIKELRNRL